MKRKTAGNGNNKEKLNMLNMRVKKFFAKLLSRRREPAGKFLGRYRTRDVAFTFRMPAGFEGDINRVHPFDAEPCLCDPVSPPDFPGRAVLQVSGSNGVRKVAPGDSGLLAIYGIAVRQFPTQAGITPSAAQSIGTQPINPAQSLDVLRKGYIMVKVSGPVATAKGGAVFVWVAATAGNHIQGGFEAAATAGSTIALDGKTTWNGPADSGGMAELAFNI